MIAALALAVLVGVDYLDVPPEVERVTALRWHAGGAPAPIDVLVNRNGSRLRLLLPQGSPVVVVLQRHDGAYLIDGPATLGDADVERRLDGVWRSTVQGGASVAVPGAPPIAWLGAAGGSGDQWPACWWRTVPPLWPSALWPWGRA